MIGATVAIGVVLVGVATNYFSIGTLNQSDQVTLANQQLQERIMVTDVSFHSLLSYSTKNASGQVGSFQAAVNSFIPAPKSFVASTVFLGNITTLPTSVVQGSSYTLGGASSSTTSSSAIYSEYNPSVTSYSTNAPLTVNYPSTNKGVWYGQVAVALPTNGSSTFGTQCLNQKASGSGNSVSCTLTVTGGQDVVVFVGVTSSVSSVTISGGSYTYTTAGTTKVTVTSPNSVETGYYTQAKSSGSLTVTATISSGTPAMFITCMAVTANVPPTEIGIGIHLINYGLVNVNIVSVYANLTGTMAPETNFSSFYGSNGLTISPSYQAKIVFPYSYVKGYGYSIELVSSAGSTFTSQWSA